MKISHKLCVRMDGTQVFLLWWVTAKNERGNDKRAWVYNLKLTSSMDSNPKVLQTVTLELFPASLSRKNYSRRIWKTIQLLWPPTATLSFLIIQDLNLIWSGKKSVFISSAQCYSLGNVCLWFPPRDDSKPVFCSRFLYISYRFDLKCV